MTSTTFFIIFIPILAILLLAINLLLAPHNPYQEKDSAFECGFHSFLGQNRTQFSVSFFIFGLLFLLFDLEILLVYPYSVSSYTNDIYGLVIMMVFFVLLTLGFIFELGKNALTIDSRQNSSYEKEEVSTHFAYISVSDILYQMGINLEQFVYRLPNGDQLATNRTARQLSQYSNHLVDTMYNMRDNIISQANRELMASNLTEELRMEIASYMVDANTTAGNGITILAEGIRGAMVILF